MTPLHSLTGALLFFIACQSAWVQAQVSNSAEDLISPRLCVASEQLPLQHINKGAMTGIMADFKQIISHQFSRPITIIETSNEQDSLQLLSAGQCDLLFMLINQQHENLIYSNTISSYPLAMAVLSHVDIDIDSNAYQDKKIVVGLNHSAQFDDSVTESISVAAALSAVSMGVIDGLVDAMPTLLHELNNSHRTNIKIVELADSPLTLKLAMRADNRVLMAEMNTIIDTITPQHINDINKKWFPIPYQAHPSDWSKWLWAIIAIFLVNYFIVTKHKNSLNKQIQQLNTHNNQLNKELSNLKHQENLGLRFVEIISHEYRTPVSVISTNADILELKNQQGNLGLSGQINKIRDAVTRLITIVETTLDREHLGSENMIAKINSFDFKQCLSQVLDELNRSYMNRIVSLKCNQEEMPYFGDIKLIHLMMRNIIENTFKYSPTSEPVEISLHLHKKYLEIIVRDRGIGIPNTEIEHIFEKYHRAANTTNTPGIGVGLYLSKSIVMQHQGEINVRCPQDGGTEVLIILPLKHQRTEG